VSTEATGFLYPFIDAEERDAAALMADLARSAHSKMVESRNLRVATLERCREDIDAAATAMAACFLQDGRLLAFGNGGSATDAEGTVDLFRRPPHGRPLPSLSLVDDPAVLTALSNDVGFELVFSRQVIAHGKAGDIAVGFSTSGDSVNMLRAFEEAARRDLLTIGLCGYQGGATAMSDAVHHCFVVHSESVHRIQEAQNALMLELWSTVQYHLPESEAP
jgi:D-sedoheptulose 7-phosphate isomerase